MTTTKQTGLKLICTLVLLCALILVHIAGANASEETNTENNTHESGGGEHEEETNGGRIALVAAVTVTILVAISILFELGTEIMHKKTDEANVPFLNSVFNELTTLGFTGLLLFVSSQLEMVPWVSRTVLGNEEELKEIIF